MTDTLELGLHVADSLLAATPAGHQRKEGRLEVTYVVGQPRARRALGEDGQRALEHLIAKNKLTPYERGQLQALARSAGPHDRERAQAKLHRTRGGDGGRGGGSRISQETMEAWSRAIEAALDREDDR
jgi:hypothetical protein